MVILGVMRRTRSAWVRTIIRSSSGSFPNHDGPRIGTCGGLGGRSVIVIDGWVTILLATIKLFIFSIFWALLSGGVMFAIVILVLGFGVWCMASEEMCKNCVLAARCEYVSEVVNFKSLNHCAMR
jgi:hypothetical protein